MAAKWMDEEAENLRRQKEMDEQREERGRKLSDRALQCWDGFKTELRNQIASFNSNKAIEEEYCRKVEIESDGLGEIVLSSHTFPSIGLSVKFGYSNIEIDSVVNVPIEPETWTSNTLSKFDDVTSTRNHEIVPIIAGPDDLPWLEAPENRFPFSDLAEYILRKFLVKPTIFPYLQRFQR